MYAVLQLQDLAAGGRRCGGVDQLRRGGGRLGGRRLFRGEDALRYLVVQSADLLGHLLLQISYLGLNLTQYTQTVIPPFLKF